ncbi:MAG: cytochrome c oxidase accessory protein CcoG [Colwellia sp.]|nr:cytochrome c oxidase accessory protein CcoG [Colwellia sp.]
MKYNFKDEDLIIKPYKNDSPIYVRKQKGKYQRIRKFTGLFFMCLFALLPWFEYQGQQAILLDLETQHFRIFSQTFFPQDLTLLALLLLVGCFLLFFITTWLGRIWCGYLCPQTVWMFTYIWVEEKIEGTRNQRIGLDQKQTSLNKVLKKISKHSLWLLMSVLTATCFISYFTPVTQLYRDLLSFNSSAIITGWIVFFTLCTYGNAGWLREKMCIYMCPYSRFQSAMFDKNTFLVAYDKKRGETRGVRKRSEHNHDLGDCVDCSLCVDVCPAGIDIRNGLQYECINCGACIDACDQTMEKFNYPKGLISYTSESNLAGKKTNLFRGKILAYASLSMLFVALMINTIVSRVPLEVSISRDRNTLYQVDFNDNVSNTYLIKITNKSQLKQHYSIKVNGNNKGVLTMPDTMTINASEAINIPVTLTRSPQEIKTRISNITFVVSALSAPDVRLSKTTRFYSR